MEFKGLRACSCMCDAIVDWWMGLAGYLKALIDISDHVLPNDLNFFESGLREPVVTADMLSCGLQKYLLCMYVNENHSDVKYWHRKLSNIYDILKAEVLLDTSKKILMVQSLVEWRGSWRIGGVHVHCTLNASCIDREALMRALCQTSHSESADCGPNFSSEKLLSLCSQLCQRPYGFIGACRRAISCSFSAALSIIHATLSFYIVHGGNNNTLCHTSRFTLLASSTVIIIKFK